MTSNRFPWVAMLVLVSLTGCAMCDNFQDCTYPAFGGKWQRDNPHSGRVGSLFDPAGAQISGQIMTTPAEPTLAEPETAETTETAEGTESVEGAEGATEPLLDKPRDRDSATMGGPETTQPETAESTEPGEGAKPKAEQDTPDDVLPLPAMPSESPKTEAPKKSGTSLLPPLELPPQP